MVMKWPYSLHLLQADGQVDYYINWVARNDNVKDFPVCKPGPKVWR